MIFDPADLKESDRICARLNACQSAEEIETVAGEERAVVTKMRDGSVEAKTLAIQIANLKHYRLLMLARGK